MRLFNGIPECEFGPPRLVPSSPKDVQAELGRQKRLADAGYLKRYAPLGTLGWQRVRVNLQSELGNSYVLRWCWAGNGLALPGFWKRFEDHALAWEQGLAEARKTLSA